MSANPWDERKGGWRQKALFLERKRGLERDREVTVKRITGRVHRLLENKRDNMCSK